MEKWRYRRDDSRTVAIRAGHEPSRSFTFMGGRLLVYQGLNSRNFQKEEGPAPGSVKLNEGSLPVLVETTFWQIILPSSSCYLYYVIHLQSQVLSPW